MTWQPIHAAPMDGTVVDLWCRRSWNPPEPFERRAGVYWCTVHKRWRTTGNSHYVEETFVDQGYGSHHLIPTHWMPTPEPPVFRVDPYAQAVKISWSEPDAA